MTTAIGRASSLEELRRYIDSHYRSLANAREPRPRRPLDGRLRHAPHRRRAPTSSRACLFLELMLPNESGPPRLCAPRPSAATPATPPSSRARGGIESTRPTDGESTRNAPARHRFTKTSSDAELQEGRRTPKTRRSISTCRRRTGPPGDRSEVGHERSAGDRRSVRPASSGRYRAIALEVGLQDTLLRY